MSPLMSGMWIFGVLVESLITSDQFISSFYRIEKTNMVSQLQIPVIYFMPPLSPLNVKISL